MSCRFALLMLAMAFVLVSTNGPTQSPAAAATDNASARSDAANAHSPDAAEKYNDIALYISGMELPQSSGLYPLTANPAWRQYASVTGATWAGFSKTKIKKITDWSNAEINDLHQSCRTLFYPFSGPDFLYAHAFFPQADTYVLLGLEPVGRVPDPENFQGEKAGAYFRMLDKSIADALTLSFFKTNDMADEINQQQPVTGTVPVLMLFLARTGNRVADIRFFDLDDTGAIAYRDAPGAGHAAASRGAELSFYAKNDARQRKLMYISADISDRGLARHKNVRAYLDRLDSGFTTYIKSASYLMHKNYFSVIRSLILRQSSAVVQDDSAIPYRFFDKSAWDITLYGAYAGPIDLFKVHLEKDLKEAYARQSKKLVFRLGYASQSNLLVARKAGQQNTERQADR